jgi:hypothetical protein
MAKRKASRTRKKAGKTTRKAGAARKMAPRKKTAARNSRAGARKAVARKSGARGARKASGARQAGGAAKARRAAGIRRAGSARTAAPKVAARKAPSLDRARRTIQGDDIVPTPPSSLDLDRTASAARTGRRQMRERLNEHNETSPALTAGDVDADWESAATVGDEAPGGDNPTPDQDIVDDIGKAVGVQYEDNEELKGEAKISKRDKHRWELDPASSEDFKDR